MCVCVSVCLCVCVGNIVAFSIHILKFHIEVDVKIQTMDTEILFEI